MKHPLNMSEPQLRRYAVTLRRLANYRAALSRTLASMTRDPDAFPRYLFSRRTNGQRR